MELGRVDLYGRELGIANNQAFGVGVGVDLGAHCQAATRFGIGDEVHDHLMADQRSHRAQSGAHTPGTRRRQSRKKDAARHITASTLSPCFRRRPNAPAPPGMSSCRCAW